MTTREIKYHKRNKPYYSVSAQQIEGFRRALKGYKVEPPAERERLFKAGNMSHGYSIPIYRITRFITPMDTL